MKTTKYIAGWVALAASVPAIAQGTGARVSAAICASCPAGDGQVIVPSDPTWFIAGAGVGLLLGIIGTWVFDLRRRR